MTGVITLEDLTSSSNLSESYQSVPLKFVTVVKVGKIRKALHPWILCRDFFNEIIAAPRIQADLYIHGFSVRKDWPQSRITNYLIKAPTNAVMEDIERHKVLALKLFNEYFSMVRPTSITLVDEQRRIFEVVAPKCWSKMTQLLSYHSQFVRLIANPVSPEGSTYSDLWLNWRNADQSNDVDLDKLRSIHLSVIQNFHKFVSNILNELKKNPKLKTLPKVLLTDSYYNDDDDDDEECDEGVYLYDFHDTAGWQSCAEKLGAKRNTLKAFYNEFPKWDQF